MMMLKRLSCFLLMALVAMAVFAGGGGQQGGGTAIGADDYPNKPIRIILPVAPGGSMELIARQWEPYLAKELGVPLMLDCIPGAESMIGGRVAAESAPDGYTFIMWPLGYLPIHELLLGAPYKIEDFEIISNFNTDPNAVFVHKDSPWKSMREIMALPGL